MHYKLCGYSCNPKLNFTQLPKEEGRMKEACESMLSLYPNQSYPLEILCSYYLETGKTLVVVR